MTPLGLGVAQLGEWLPRVYKVLGFICSTAQARNWVLSTLGRLRQEDCRESVRS